MPRGPKGEKRPADVIGNAVHVMGIAKGEIEENASAKQGKDYARKGGLKGGRARAAKLTDEHHPPAETVSKREPRIILPKHGLELGREGNSPPNQTVWMKTGFSSRATSFRTGSSRRTSATSPSGR
jgi:hypothetical protein